MKKIPSFFLALAGATCFAQSSIFVMNNYNHNDAVGRFMTASPNPVPVPYMFSAPNGSFGMYTIPAGVYSKYTTFDTTGTTPYPMNINTWYVTDPVNPANSGSYPYNHPFITSMNAINEWAVFFFVLQNSSGNFVDSYTVGDPSIASNVGVTNVNAYQTGINSNIDAEWFTISTSPGVKVTYFSIYP